MCPAAGGSFYEETHAIRAPQIHGQRGFRARFSFESGRNDRRTKANRGNDRRRVSAARQGSAEGARGPNTREGAIVWRVCHYAAASASSLTTRATSARASRQRRLAAVYNIRD